MALVEPISGAPLALEPLPPLPAIDDAVMLASLQTQRAWLEELFVLELTRELRDESSTELPGPASDAGEARRARVRTCVAKLAQARDDLLASERLQLSCL